MTLTARQLVSLVLITLVWGCNWAIMKVGVEAMPPLLFRAFCLWVAVPAMAALMIWQKIPFAVPRNERVHILRLGMVNMVLWNMLMILALPLLSSGRAAILCYTMPAFSAVIGARLYHTTMRPRHLIGIAAALAGAVLLLWHEASTLAGQPLGVFLALSAAFCWGLGTQMLRHARFNMPIATFTFWAVLFAVVVITVACVVIERPQLTLPDTGGVMAILYNGLLVLSVAQVAWFYLARGLPPQASSLSVMLIPVIGVFSGVLLLGEHVHWQDSVAALLMLAAMFSVLWPAERK